MSTWEGAGTSGQTFTTTKDVKKNKKKNSIHKSKPKSAIFIWLYEKHFLCIQLILNKGRLLWVVLRECLVFWYNNKLIDCVKSVGIRIYFGSHFSAFGLNTERYGLFLCIQSECGKMRTRITPNTDTFYAVDNLNVFFSENTAKHSNVFLDRTGLIGMKIILKLILDVKTVTLPRS